MTRVRSRRGLAVERVAAAGCAGTPRSSSSRATSVSTPTRARCRPLTLTAWWRFIAHRVSCAGRSYRGRSRGSSAALGFRRAVRSLLLLGHPERPRAPRPSRCARGSERRGERTSLSPKPPQMRPLPAGDGRRRCGRRHRLERRDGTGSRSAVRTGPVIEAGGEHSPEADRDRAGRACRPRSLRVARVVTKSWEPPLLELHDFLTTLRAADWTGGVHRRRA